MKKRVLMIFLAAVVAFVGMPIMQVSAADIVEINDDLEIEYRVTESSISVGEGFDLFLSISKANDISNIRIELIDNSFFTVPDENSSITFDDLEKEYSFWLTFNRTGSNNVPLKVFYNQDGEKSKEFNILIEAIEEDDSSSSSSSSENEPILIIESTSIPVAAAGESMKIPLTITNESKYSARNISVKLSLSDGDDNPFDMSSLNLIQSISSLNARKSDGIIFSLKVKPHAEEKTYEIDVEFNYSNTKNRYFSSNEKIYVKVTNNMKEPVLAIQDIKYGSNPVKAGEKLQVSFNVSNMGDLDAEGIKLSVEGLNKDGFTLSSGVDSWYIDSIKGNGKKNIILNLAAADTMASGNHELAIKMDYKDLRNNTYSNDTSFFINVRGDSKISNITLDNITVMPQEVKANENFMLSFDVHNQGKSDARNVVVTVKGDDGIVSKSPDVKIIEGLAAGEQTKLEYILYANNEAVTKNYNIMINLEYEDAEKADSKYSVNQYAGIYVNGENNKITPKIIISNYNFEPKLVRAGEEFSIDLTFMNTSMTKEVKNIKIYLTGIDSDNEGNVVFTPVGSSNTFFVDSIKPKGTAARSITMYTIPDAQPKYYNITANIEYQDDEGTEYKAAELVGIPVIQQSKLDASEISLPPEVFIGQPTPISLQYYNKGKTKLSNLMIKVDGDFQIENGEAFIGNFESGSSDYYEAMLIATKPGAADGRVIFSFEDPSGEEFTYEREFTINAMEMPVMDMSGEMPPPPLSTKDKIMNYTIKSIYFWIGIVVFVAAILVSRRLIKNKRRKVMELDE
jgi:hypothetical protein